MRLPKTVLGPAVGRGLACSSFFLLFFPCFLLPFSVQVCRWRTSSQGFFVEPRRLGLLQSSRTIPWFFSSVVSCRPGFPVAARFFGFPCRGGLAKLSPLRQSLLPHFLLWPFLVFFPGLGMDASLFADGRLLRFSLWSHLSAFFPQPIDPPSFPCVPMRLTAFCRFPWVLCFFWPFFSLSFPFPPPFWMSPSFFFFAVQHLPLPL